MALTKITSNMASLDTLTANNGVLELDDNGSHNGIINVPASLSINIDSDNGATTESFTISKDKTGINDTDVLFRVLENGNVGIGGAPVSTTSGYDGAVLHIQQSGTGSSVGSQVRLSSGSSGHAAGDGSYIAHWGDSNLYIANQENAGIFFYTNGSERIEIASGGQVGINQSSPANHARLVTKPSATSETCFQFNNNADARRWFYIVDGHYGYQGVEQIYSNGGVNRYFNNASGTTVGSIVVNSGGTSFNATSDYRLKDNPQALTGSGDFIDGLQPKTWTWNHGDGGTGVGFIAHEAATVGYGLCVTGEKDAVSVDKVLNEETGEYEEQTTPTYQQLDYSSGELIGNIVAELQALRTRVATLETELDAAEARITTLENA